MFTNLEKRTHNNTHSLSREMLSSQEPNFTYLSISVTQTSQHCSLVANHLIPYGSTTARASVSHFYAPRITRALYSDTHNLFMVTGGIPSCVYGLINIQMQIMQQSQQCKCCAISSISLGECHPSYPCSLLPCAFGTAQSTKHACSDSI